VSFAALTFRVASQLVFIVVSIYFFIDSVRKLLDTSSYIRYLTLFSLYENRRLAFCSLSSGGEQQPEMWSISLGVRCRTKNCSPKKNLRNVTRSQICVTLVNTVINLRVS